VIIDLSELQREPYGFDVDFEVTAEEMQHPVVPRTLSLHLEGTVRRFRSGFKVEGRLEAHGSVSCSRCMTPIPWS